MTNSTNTVAKNKNIKDMLLKGAKVNYGFNGNEFVYTIDGVNGLEVSTKGYIIDKGDVKYPKPSNDTVYITARKGFNAVNIAYKSLILMLNGYVPKGGLIIEMKNPDLGFRPDNIKLLSKFSRQEISFDTLQRTGTKLTGLVIEEDKTVIDPAVVYTEKSSSIEYVAEDGSAFDTLEAAAIWQREVSAAKEVAQVVLDYNKGLYGVAEKAFLRVVKYEGDTKPYANFRDVMDNDRGVTERKTKEVVQFKKFKVGEEPMFAHLFSNKAYTQETAQEILEGLALVKDIYHNLEMLSKQSV